MKQWRENNKEKLKEYRKTTYLNNKEDNNKRSKEYYHLHKDKYQEVNKQYHIDHPEKRILSSCKSTAKIRGLEFDLDISDIVIPQYCPILKVELTNLRGKGRTAYNPSIDRLDSSRGYVKGNVWIISDIANRMKTDATKEQLVAFAKGVLDIYD